MSDILEFETQSMEPVDLTALTTIKELIATEPEPEIYEREPEYEEPEYTESEESEESGSESDSEQEEYVYDEAPDNEEDGSEEPESENEEPESQVEEENEEEGSEESYYEGFNNKPPSFQFEDVLDAGSQSIEGVFDEDIGGQSIEGSSIAIAAGLGYGLSRKTTVLFYGVILSGVIALVMYVVWRKMKKLKSELETLERQQEMSISDKDVRVITTQVIEEFLNSEAPLQEAQLQAVQVEISQLKESHEKISPVKISPVRQMEPIMEEISLEETPLEEISLEESKPVVSKETSNEISKILTGLKDTPILQKDIPTVEELEDFEEIDSASSKSLSEKILEEAEKALEEFGDEFGDELGDEIDPSPTVESFENSDHVEKLKTGLSSPKKRGRPRKKSS